MCETIGYWNLQLLLDFFFFLGLGLKNNFLLLFKSSYLFFNVNHLMKRNHPKAIISPKVKNSKNSQPSDTPKQSNPSRGQIRNILQSQHHFRQLKKIT